MAKNLPITLVPRPLPATAARKRKIPDVLHQTLHAYEAAMGGRQALIQALSVGENDPEVEEVLVALALPEHDALSLATICARAGITPGQLFRAVQAAALARAKVLATLTVADRTPEIVRQALDHAVLHEEVCESCNGTGTYTADPTPRNPNPQPQPCTSCRGLGVLKVGPTIEHQKMALEMAGLLKKAAGINVNNNMITPPAPRPSDSLDALQQAISDVMYGRAGAVDAEVTDRTGEDSDPEPEPES